MFTEPDHSRMLSNYLPVLLFLITGIVIGVAALAAGRVLSPRNPYPAKLSAYECGFEAFEDARMKFDVRYYLVAILFIIFDLGCVPLSVGGFARRDWNVWFLLHDDFSGRFNHWLYL